MLDPESAGAVFAHLAMGLGDKKKELETGAEHGVKAFHATSEQEKLLEAT